MKHALSILIISSISIFSHAQQLQTFEGKAGTEEDFESIMISLGGGCNLGCAIGWSLGATSVLADQGANTYGTGNMDDGDRNTAWVEGEKYYGIGERIIITFHGDESLKDIPFDGIEITNGYAKSQSTWEANSRVKLFKVHLNGQPHFFIKLQDSMYPQTVSWGRDFHISSGDKVELEIVEVYPGSKWKDTAISDLSLDGAH